MTLPSSLLEELCADPDAREERLRQVVLERLALSPPPTSDEMIVATYFLVLRTQKLVDFAAEIAYHATSGTKHVVPGSLIEECTGRTLAMDEFDPSGRIGLVHIGFPLKMMQHPDGHVTSTDILHTTASAIIFDVYESQDARLLNLAIPQPVLQTFPGPVYGPQGLRKLVGFPAEQLAFGTILKPTAGLTPRDVERLVSDAARCPMFLFVKEDENFYPDLAYAPIAERTRLATEAIKRTVEARGGADLIFAPHVTGAPHEILAFVHEAIAAGARAVMFSESFAGGTVRMVREATSALEHPPAIYGHNAGIGVKTRAIWREVIDLLARLDGIDFRQTAPLLNGTAFIRPYGAEWLASEESLVRRLDGIRPTMITRAGGLDQGNIILNLEDCEKRGISDQVLFLAGSAINSILGPSGAPDPLLGARAMEEALEVHRSGEMAGVPRDEHIRALVAVADHQDMTALREALRQRYPGQAA